jgi:hypothetical protein
LDSQFLEKDTGHHAGDYPGQVAGEPFAAVLNGIPKVVVSTTLQST